MFKAEVALRTLAAKCNNVYIISLFACCRQRYDAKICSGLDKTIVDARIEHEEAKSITQANLDEIKEYATKLKIFKDKNIGQKKETGK